MPSNSINSNAYASALCHNLEKCQKGLSTTLTRMSSGFRIQSAKDDAAGCVISAKMNVKLAGLQFANNNIQNSNNMLNVAQSAYMNINNLLGTLRSLSLQALDDSYDINARQAMQDEGDQLLEELQRIKVATKFNSIKLFDNYEEREIPEQAQEPAAPQEPSEPQEPNEPQGEPGEPQTFAMRAFSTSPLSVSNVPEEIEEVGEVEAPAMMLMSASPMLASLPGEEPEIISGAIDLAANQANVELTIGEVVYTLKNLKNYDQSVSYSKNTSTGQITFTCNDMEIKGQNGYEHNYLINGQRNRIYGADLEDTFEFYDTYSSSNYAYGMGGNDTFNLTKTVSNNCYGDYGSDAEDNRHDDCGDDVFYVRSTGYTGSLNGGNGNDTFNVITGVANLNGGNGNDIFNYESTASNGYSATGNAGNDTFNIYGGTATLNGNSGTNTYNVNYGNHTINGGSEKDIININAGTNTIYGNNGDDEINVKTSNNKIYGNAGEDTINIISGDGNYVDGGAGTNAITDNGTNTTKLNVPGGVYSTVISFARQEE